MPTRFKHRVWSGHRTRGRSAASLATILLTACFVCLATAAGAEATFTVPGAPIAAGGAHSCSVQADGPLACWGDDSAGQVTDAPGGEFLAVSTGAAHTCAIRLDRRLVCWGDDSAGQVSGAPDGDFVTLSAGGAQTCAIDTEWRLACWGDDSSGQVSEVPEGKFAAVSTGAAHTCAVRLDRRLVCWGDDSAGQATGGPKPVKHYHHWYWYWHWYWHWPRFSAVAAGAAHTCAIGDDKKLVCWGDDSAGQVSGAPEGEFAAVTAGREHSCAVRAGDKSLVCWGDDSAGQVGDAPAGEYLAVSAGGDHSCAERIDGAAICWGDNEQGQVQPRIISPTPPAGVVGAPYFHRFLTTPQSPAPQFKIASGQLPAGLTLDPAGTLTGLPTSAGTYAFTVAAVNGILPDAEQSASQQSTEQSTVVQIAAPAAAAPAALSLPPPVAGESVNVIPTSGVVKIRCPGKAGKRLRAPAQVAIKCLINVRNGVVTLKSATAKGKKRKIRSGRFWGGVFGTSQRKAHEWDTELRLVGGLGCGKASAAGDGPAGHSARKRGRKLWGKGKGRYKTTGNHGSASVRGTTWLVSDRCDRSTLFSVREGTVWVRDFVKKRQVVLHAGERYVARAARPRRP